MSSCSPGRMTVQECAEAAAPGCEDPAGGDSALASATVTDSRFCFAELHCRSGHEQGRGFPVEVPQCGVGAADELPAAGGGAGVDAGEFPGQGHSSDGHAGAW